MAEVTVQIEPLCERCGHERQWHQPSGYDGEDGTCHHGDDWDGACEYGDGCESFVGDKTPARLRTMKI